MIIYFLINVCAVLIIHTNCMSFSHSIKILKYHIYQNEYIAEVKGK